MLLLPIASSRLCFLPPMVCLPSSFGITSQQRIVVPDRRQTSCRAATAAPIPSLILVAAGGRHLNWSALRIAAVLRAHLAGQRLHCLLHGGACKADAAIAAAADYLAWPTETFPADWSRLGLAADSIRHRAMIRRACELAAARSFTIPTAVVVIALPGSRGPSSLLAQARRLQTQMGLPIEISNLSGDPLPRPPVAMLRACDRDGDGPVACPTLRALG